MSFRAVGIGELLWDLLPGGKKMGGAPANFAFHARELGSGATVVSRVGNDDLGRELVARIAQLGLNASAVEIDPSSPTSTVTVELDAGQPRYVIHENVAWENLSGETAAQKAVEEADVICFGSLAQRREPARSAILKLVGKTPPDALRIFDINLRQHYYSRPVIEASLELANTLKVNDSELPILSEMFGLRGEARAQLQELARSYKLNAIAYTRGAHGSLLWREGEWSDQPGVPVQVADTVGAGDAFTAAMAAGLLRRWDLDTVNKQANKVAAYVASCAGATPSLPPDLKTLFLT